MLSPGQMDNQFQAWRGQLVEARERVDDKVVEGPSVGTDSSMRSLKKAGVPRVGNVVEVGHRGQ
eukprot:11170711-Lingulodinium_polyedra.AAC.1